MKDFAGLLKVLDGPLAIGAALAAVLLLLAGSNVWLVWMAFNRHLPSRAATRFLIWPIIVTATLINLALSVSLVVIYISTAFGRAQPS